MLLCERSDNAVSAGYKVSMLSCIRFRIRTKWRNIRCRRWNDEVDLSDIYSGVFANIMVGLMVKGLPKSFVLPEQAVLKSQLTGKPCPHAEWVTKCCCSAEYKRRLQDVNGTRMKEELQASIDSVFDIAYSDVSWRFYAI